MSHTHPAAAVGVRAYNEHAKADHQQHATRLLSYFTPTTALLSHMMYTGAHMGACRPSVTHDKPSQTGKSSTKHERYVRHSVSMGAYVLRRSGPQVAAICRETDVSSENREGRKLQAYSTVSVVH